MKKITLKITTILLLTMFAFQVNAQANFTGNGIYKISTSGVTPELYLTIDGSTGDLVWAEELTPDNAVQLWTIVDHREPASAGYMEITANIPGVGDFTMGVDQSTIAIDPVTGLFDQADNEFRITVRPGLPVGDVNDPEYGFDQFQRRKAKVDENGLADPNGSNPPGNPNNNALFIKPSGANGGSRYGVVPAAAGEEVFFDGGGIDVIQFHVVEFLSTEEFDTSSVFISNPVKNELLVEGLNQSIEQIAVYDLLGKQVISNMLTGDVSSTKLDVSALTSGIYLVRLQGANGASLTRKIIKE